ncbi:MAG: bifunctional glutamine synthetase adenylyltransferase/deadenyltransferase, partial [Proteobacteria bacterium]
MSDPSTGLIERAAALSRFARRLLVHPPRLFEPSSVADPCDRSRIRAMLGAVTASDQHTLARVLRQVRQAVLLHTIVRDLNGLATLAEVFDTVTALAEESLQCASRHLEGWLRQSFGTPRAVSSGLPLSLVVVGMGKLGGQELNVSSDVDLVLLYPEEGHTDGTRSIENQDFFTRLARQLIGALAEYTEDGHVFRVDMRLRPYGDSGPLTMSYDALEAYLQTQGREWERYAWVKARVIGASPCPTLDNLITPFVYRRHLDYSAIASLRSLHAQIRAEVTRRDLHDNIKLGPGGIREVEFVTQMFQLVRGGRDADLRVRPTLAALRALENRRVLPDEAVRQLSDAYRYLRNLEHRLQYLDDQQTQT